MRRLWLASLMATSASGYVNALNFSPAPLPGDDQTSEVLDPYCELIESNATVLEFVSKRRELSEWEDWVMNESPNGVVTVKGQGDWQYQNLSGVPFDTSEKLIENWVLKKVKDHHEKQSEEKRARYEFHDTFYLEEKLAGVISYCAFKHSDSDFRFLYFGPNQRAKSEYAFDGWVEKTEKELAKISVPTRSIDDEGNLVETAAGDVTAGAWIGYDIERQSPTSKLNGHYSGLGGYRDNIIPTAIIIGGSKVIDNVGGLVLAAYDEAIAYYENARSGGESAAEALAEAERIEQLKEARAEELRAKEQAELKQKLISGQLEPRSISEAVLKWSAEGGAGIVASPPLQADKKYYSLWGRLELVNGDDSYTFRQMELNITYGGGISRDGAMNDFFVGNLERNAVVIGALRADGEYRMVGQFVDTVETKLVSGETVFSAVFKVVFLE